MKFFAAITLFLMIANCGPKVINMNRPKLSTANTQECKLQQEVCEQAFEFQNEFNRMPPEEQKDFRPVLNTYYEHCTKATKQCEKSLKK